MFDLLCLDLYSMQTDWSVESRGGRKVGRNVNNQEEFSPVLSLSPPLSAVG